MMWCKCLQIVELCFDSVKLHAEHPAKSHHQVPEVFFSARLCVPKTVLELRWLIL